MAGRNKPRLVAHHDFVCDYDSPVLSLVCTLKEACYLWNKSETTLRDALYRGLISGRKSFTGGDILLETASLEKRYGAPKENTLWDLQKS